MSLATDECGGDDDGDEDGLIVLRRCCWQGDTAGDIRVLENDERDSVTHSDTDYYKARRVGLLAKRASKVGQILPDAFFWGRYP